MKITSFAKTSLAVATFAAMAGMSSIASGAVINDMFGLGLNEVEDTDADRICTGACTGSNSVTSGAFATGQVIESLLRFNDINATAISSQHPAPYQLIAYATLTIDALVELNTGAGAGQGNGDTTCDIGEVCLAITTPVVQLFDTSSVPANFFNEAPATAIAQVLAETPILSLGLVEPDDFWVIQFTHTGSEIASIAAATGATDPQAGLYQFGVSATSNPGGIPFKPNGIVGADGNLHDFAGDGSGFGRSPGVNDGWLLSTNTLAQFQAVPEPGSLVLLGMALAGAGWIRRRHGRS